ncbi:MAG: helix-turn-helix domain-containing protein [Alphaproteobacteria bacterium]|nr:helix-turn-helix domain-containing protein [Alphaproteobacteria bacterium]
MNMENIGSRQIKAARALLDWSQDDLASATKLSIATVRKLELGYISPRSSTTDVLRHTLEEAGIEFTDADGVRRRQEEVRIYQGAHGCLSFLEDVISTAKKDGSELFAVASSDLALAYLFGAEAGICLERAIASQDISSAKIILTDTLDLPLSTPRLEYRSISSNYVDPMPFCVYGDKYALVAASDSRVSKIIVVQSSAAARSSKRQFESMWEKAICSLAVATEKNVDYLPSRRAVR